MKKILDTRCVVTGLGMISAIGNSVAECWNNALAGVSGIKEVTSVNTADCYANLGAESNCEELGKDDTADRSARLCLKASKEAVEDAGLILTEEEKDRVGVIMGSCVGGVNSIESYVVNGEKTEDIRKMTISPIANYVADYVGAKGIITNVGNACAAGSISVAYACELIRAGVADVFIVGGADVFGAVPFSGFHALHALSEQACSPFNHSNGITLGEGAGAMVVESLDHAKKRNAKIYCDVLSAGISSDAHHITAPRPDGIGQMYAIRTAISKSGLEPKDIDYVNAHGTGTAKNDEAEFLSLHTIFDDSGANLSVSSTKAMVGHCLGAAGAIEAVFAVKALTENKIPPTIGYSEEDLAVLKEKAGAIDFMPNTMKEKELHNVMSNSFAFGGSNASIIFSKKEGSVVETENDEPVYITGLGLVSPVANNIPDYIAKVNDGEELKSDSVCTEIGKPDFEKYGVKMPFFRKLDKLSGMQVISGMEAITDSGIAIEEADAEQYGMIIGTGDGPIHTVYQFQEHIAKEGNQNGSAFNFPNTVYNAAGGYLSIKTGMRGYNVTVTNGNQSGLGSVCYAYHTIRQDRAKVMLASGTDENSEIMTKLYKQLGVVTKDSANLYQKEKGMTLADGSATVLLERGDSAEARNAKKYAKIVGYGMTHEVAGNSITGTENGLVAAITKAAADAGISVNDIDAVFGLGNGCKEVDDLEKKAYSRLFTKEVPVHNVRLYTGEGRAAACTLSVAHAALTLSGDLNSTQKAFILGPDSAQEKMIDTSAYRYIVAVGYAEGGSYAAVVLEKCE